jgi:hypothetical protein
MDKVKNFDEFYVNPIMEGLFQHADWVDMDLLQGTIERMRSEEYKGALANLNQQYPLDSGIKFGFDTVEKDEDNIPEPPSPPMDRDRKPWEK